MLFILGVTRDEIEFADAAEGVMRRVPSVTSVALTSGARPVGGAGLPVARRHPAPDQDEPDDGVVRAMT